MLHNYHTHTFRNHHAVGTEREYIEAAIAGGYQTLGFSEHAPYQFPDGIVSYFHMFPEYRGRRSCLPPAARQRGFPSAGRHRRACSPPAKI